MKSGKHPAFSSTAECGSNPENRSCDLDTYSTRGCWSQRGLFAQFHTWPSLCSIRAILGEMCFPRASIQPCRRENRPGKVFAFKQPSKLDPRSCCWASSWVIKYCLCSWLRPQCEVLETTEISRAWEGIWSWTCSLLCLGGLADVWWQGCSVCAQIPMQTGGLGRKMQPEIPVQRNKTHSVTHSFVTIHCGENLLSPEVGVKSYTRVGLCWRC